MPALVTIAIPVNERLEHLPDILRMIAAQDYPAIELLVSDNGRYQDVVPATVRKHYPKPYRLKQNPDIVSLSTQYNQLIENSSGEYVSILADDEEISPNFVSELMHILHAHTEASAALAMEEAIDAEGHIVWRSSTLVPDRLGDEDFIRSTFSTGEHGYKSLNTFLAKKERLVSVGGFPDIGSPGSSSVLLVKLCLDSSIAFSTRCSSRKSSADNDRHEALETMLQDLHEYLVCIDTDPFLVEYAALQPSKWSRLRSYLIQAKLFSQSR